MDASERGLPMQDPCPIRQHFVKIMICSLGRLGSTPHLFTEVPPSDTERSIVHEVEF